MKRNFFIAFFIIVVLFIFMHMTSCTPHHLEEPGKIQNKNYGKKNESKVIIEKDPNEDILKEIKSPALDIWELEMAPDPDIWEPEP